MKKTIAIFLLLTLLFHSVGGLFTYFIGKSIARHEAKEKLLRSLPDQQLAVLSFNEEELKTVNFEDEGKEISFNGDMYDIVRVKKEDGKTVFYCYSDSKESKLNKWFEAAIKKETEKKFPNTTKAGPVLTIVSLPQDEENASLVCQQPTTITWLEYCFSIPQTCFETATPPPDQA